MAMDNIPWQEWFNTGHREDILKLGMYKSEWDALLSTVLRELDSEPGDVEYDQAVKYATGGRCLLEYKRVGCLKARAVAQGLKEDKLYLDGPDFDYAANVCELACSGPKLVVRAAQEPAQRRRHWAPQHRRDEVVVMFYVMTAYPQADMFKPTDPRDISRCSIPCLACGAISGNLGRESPLATWS